MCLPYRYRKRIYFFIWPNLCEQFGKITEQNIMCWPKWVSKWDRYWHWSYSLTLLAGYFSCFCCHLLTFFKINFFKKLLKKHYQSASLSEPTLLAWAWGHGTKIWCWHMNLGFYCTSQCKQKREMTWAWLFALSWAWIYVCASSAGCSESRGGKFLRFLLVLCAHMCL